MARYMLTLRHHHNFIQVFALLLNRSLQQSVAMLLSITATTTLLPLVCFIGAVTGTEGGGSKQMLQPAVLPKITLEADGITTWESINMTIFKWLYNMTENVTSLTICTENPLLEENETVKGNPTLIFMEREGKKEKNIEGVVHEENSTCAVFEENGNVPLARNEAYYQLSLIASIGDVTVYKSGFITFGMPVETSTLTCNKEYFTRVARLTSDTRLLHFDGLCFNDYQKAGNESVCYLEGEFSSSYLCYTTTDLPELQVCLQGSSLTTAHEADGGFNISYLAYGSDNDTAEGHLSLEFREAQPTDNLEAIIWKGGIGSATSCLNTSCDIPFTQGFFQYDVCAVILDGGMPNETSTNTITDLDAHAFAYTASSLLQFNFINANEEQHYTAYLVDVTSGAVVHNVTVDCSAVPSNKTCHGYFEDDCFADDRRVAVEYSDAEWNSKGNKIMFGCDPITEGRPKEAGIMFESEKRNRNGKKSV